MRAWDRSEMQKENLYALEHEVIKAKIEYKVRSQREGFAQSVSFNSPIIS